MLTNSHLQKEEVKEEVEEEVEEEGEEMEEKGRGRERRNRDKGKARQILAKFLPHVSPNCHKTNLSMDPGSATEYSTSCVLALPTTTLSISSRLVSVRLVR